MDLKLRGMNSGMKCGKFFYGCPLILCCASQMRVQNGAQHHSGKNAEIVKK